MPKKPPTPTPKFKSVDDTDIPRRNGPAAGRPRLYDDMAVAIRALGPGEWLRVEVPSERRETIRSALRSTYNLRTQTRTDPAHPEGPVWFRPQ